LANVRVMYRTGRSYRAIYQRLTHLSGPVTNKTVRRK